MIEFFKKMFSDESGHPSSNRFLGAIVLITGVILVACGLRDAGAVVLTSATVLLGVGQAKSAAILAAASKKDPPAKEPPK